MEITLPWLREHQAALRRKEIEAVAALARIRGAKEFVDMLVDVLDAEGAGRPAKEGEGGDGRASGE